MAIGVAIIGGGGSIFQVHFEVLRAKVEGNRHIR